MLNLLLMRHGEAESRAPSDAQRRLTDPGRMRVRTHCEQMKSRLVESAPGIDKIISSPYVRALQTAQLAQMVLAADPPDEVSDEVPIEVWEEITPSGRSGLVARKIAQQDSSSLLIVTHQPFISNLIAYLIGVDSSRRILMQTASIVMIELEVAMPGAGILKWVIPHIGNR